MKTFHYFDYADRQAEEALEERALVIIVGWDKRRRGRAMAVTNGEIQTEAPALVADACTWKIARQAMKRRVRQKTEASGTW